MQSLVTDVLRETGGLVLWLDAGDMLWRRPVEVLRATAANGAYSTWCVLGAACRSSRVWVA